MCQAHTALSQASIPDQADLDMDSGCEEPDLCFSRSQVRDPAYALLDSGATHVLLPGHIEKEKTMTMTKMQFFIFSIIPPQFSKFYAMYGLQLINVVFQPNSIASSSRVDKF